MRTSTLVAVLLLLGNSVPTRDENLVYDDENPIWCETNDCDIPSCHRCFPRNGCQDHQKCKETDDAS